MEQILILDLDDTIFETRSMGANVFEPFFNHLSNALKVKKANCNQEAVISDLWLMTWMEVIEKHQIDEHLFRESMLVLDKLELDLHIAPFPDYHILKNLPHAKFLVTTSLTSLQEKKIHALGIKNDFERIVINDTFKKKQSKKEIFKELIDELNLDASCVVVIGDNNDSEIKAGKELGMATIQVLRPNVLKGTHADFYIKSFTELPSLLEFIRKQLPKT